MKIVVKIDHRKGDINAKAILSKLYLKLRNSLRLNAKNYYNNTKIEDNHKN